MSIDRRVLPAEIADALEEVERGQALGRFVPRVERDMLAAYRAGYEAAERGRDPFGNPYRGLSDDARERVLSVLWRRGYSAGGRVPPDWMDHPPTLP